MPYYKISAMILQVLGLIFIGGPIGWDMLGMGGHEPGVIDIRSLGWTIIAVGIGCWLVAFLLITFRTHEMYAPVGIAREERQVMAQEVEGPMEESVEEKYHCPSCGAEVTIDATACWTCGDNFETIEYECPTCGATIAADDTTCSACGELFESSAAVATATRPPPPTIVASTNEQLREPTAAYDVKWE
jgi:predicted nucleic acid-binding Zn ribbon protein